MMKTRTLKSDYWDKLILVLLNDSCVPLEGAIVQLDQATARQSRALMSGGNGDGEDEHC